MAQEFDREAFLLNRQSGLGGSDMAPIMGLGSFGTTALDIYKSKTEPLPPDEDNPDFLRGRIGEPVAAELFVRATGRKVRRQPMRRHKQYPFLIGNIDRQLIGDPRGPGVQEIKCPRSRTISKIKAHGLVEQYVIQMQDYLEVFDYSWGVFTVFDWDNARNINFEMERDRVIGEAIVTAGATFWEKHVLQHIPPKEPKPLKLNLPKFEGEIQMIDDGALAEVLADMWEARAIFKESEALKKVADGRVSERAIELLGGYGALETPDAQRIYVKLMDGRRTFQKAAMEALAPLDPVKVAEVVGHEICTSDDELENFIPGVFFALQFPAA